MQQVKKSSAIIANRLPEIGSIFTLGYPAKKIEQRIGSVEQGS